MRPVAVLAHRRNEPPRQIVRADEIDFELLSQQRRRQIFDGAGLAVRRIIEQSRQTAPRQFERSDRTRRDRLRVGEFETQRFDALVLLEPDKIFGVTRRRDDAPAALPHRSGRVEADARRASRNQN